MFTGMLDSVADIHQLTVVVGHEMAHALLGHTVSMQTCAGSVCCCGIVFTPVMLLNLLLDSVSFLRAFQL